MIAIHPPSFFMDVRPVIEQPELQVIFWKKFICHSGVIFLQ
jgi:hypothetical protein